MAHSVRRDGAILVLVFDGHLVADTVVDAVAALEATDPDADTIGAVVDVEAIEGWTLEVEDLHRIGSVIRSRFARGPEYRFGLVSTNPRIEALVDDYLAVRDLLVAPRNELPPDLRRFDTAAAARHWVLDGDRPSGGG